MNSTLAPSVGRRGLRRRARSLRPTLPPPGLTWIHDGTRYRVSMWPEVCFEKEAFAGEWQEEDMDADVFASAALGVTANQWRGYLEFVPVTERRFLEAFPFSRMAALHLLIRCPALLPALAETPALMPFLARHLSLRGGEVSCWAEISAIFERDGIFGILQWLGLPASRQTLTILKNIVDPDLPWRLLEPLRAALWEPEAVWALAHADVLTDERLIETCHALAA